ncbi:unnamed protein product [marine sediment metagenome]|uniref:Uncharacterized protein n=1 Tax=marine sediment metagenome TaxID=412755 RepID=X1M4K9_9ZZZZ
MSPKIVEGQIWISRYICSLALMKKMSRKDSKRVWEVMASDPSGEGTKIQGFIKYLEAKEDRKKVSKELRKMVEKDKKDFYKGLNKEK